MKFYFFKTGMMSVVTMLILGIIGLLVLSSIAFPMINNIKNDADESVRKNSVVIDPRDVPRIRYDDSVQVFDDHPYAQEIENYFTEFKDNVLIDEAKYNQLRSQQGPLGVQKGVFVLMDSFNKRFNTDDLSPYFFRFRFNDNAGNLEVRYEDNLGFLFGKATMDGNIFQRDMDLCFVTKDFHRKDPMEFMTFVFGKDAIPQYSATNPNPILADFISTPQNGIMLATGDGFEEMTENGAFIKTEGFDNYKNDKYMWIVAYNLDRAYINRYTEGENQQKMLFWIYKEADDKKYFCLLPTRVWVSNDGVALKDYCLLNRCENDFFSRDFSDNIYEMITNNVPVSQIIN